MKVTGLPILLASSLLVIGAALALLVREDLAGEELVGASLMMGGGLVAFGAWMALEIVGWRQTQINREQMENTEEDG